MSEVDTQYGVQVYLSMLMPSDLMLHLHQISHADLSIPLALNLSFIPHHNFS